MKIITPVTSNDENYNGDCDYGLITIDKNDAEYLLGLMEKAQELKENVGRFYKLQVFDYSVNYFSYYEDLDEVLDVDGKPVVSYSVDVESDGVHILPNDFILPADAEQNTECDTAGIDETQIIWDAYVKHTNCKVKCKSISKELLQRIANGE